MMKLMWGKVGYFFHQLFAKKIPHPFLPEK
jgi:hypothetical protein